VIGVRAVRDWLGHSIATMGRVRGVRGTSLECPNPPNPPRPGPIAEVLEAIDARLRTLVPDDRHPHSFHEVKSDLIAELRRLAARERGRMTGWGRHRAPRGALGWPVAPPVPTARQKPPWGAHGPCVRGAPRAQAAAAATTPRSAQSDLGDAQRGRHSACPNGGVGTDRSGAAVMAVALQRAA